MSIVTDRAVGEFPVSIGTSIVLESLLGVKSEDRKFEKLENVEGIFINIKTVIRNLLNSIGGHEFSNDSNQEYADASSTEIIHALIAEIEQIQLIARGYDSNIPITFYLCKHRRIKVDFPHASYKVPTTALKIMFKRAMDLYTDKLSNELRNKKNITYFEFSNSIDGVYHHRVTMVSHQPIDLLSYRQFKDLKLLESHTGKEKSRPEFYTKLHLAKKNPRIPFNRFSIQLFGDNDFFFPQGGRLRFEVSKVAVDCNWNPLTTRDKVRFDLERKTSSDIFKQLKVFF